MMDRPVFLAYDLCGCIYNRRGRGALLCMGKNRMRVSLILSKASSTASVLLSYRSIDLEAMTIKSFIIRYSTPRLSSILRFSTSK